MSETHSNPSSQRPELQSREKHALSQESTRPGPIFRPDVDILERTDDFLVTADLPGVGAEQVVVRLEEGVLVIEAMPSMSLDPAWTPVHTEYRVGGYQRRFVLPDRIDAERIRADMKDGVLELVLPKVERQRPRRVEVRAS